MSVSTKICWINDSPEISKETMRNEDDLLVLNDICMCLYC